MFKTKYGLYKVKHLSDNGIYLMVYLGKDLNGAPRWSYGTNDGALHLKSWKKKLYAVKHGVALAKLIGTAPIHLNNENNIEILERIPLSTISVPKYELVSYNHQYLNPSPNTFTGVSTTSIKKPTKDYSKMRILNG